MKRKLTLIPATILATALGFAGIAAAHNQTITPSCAGLAFSATNYEGGGANNRVDVHLVNQDGSTSFQSSTFGSSFTMNYTWSQFQSHTWTVTIDANLNNGNPTQYDKTFTGTWAACQTPTTTTTIPATTTLPTHPPTIPDTIPEPATTLPCQEDEPCWDCATDGNRICATSTTVLVDVCCVVAPPTTPTDLSNLAPELTLPRTGGAALGIILLATVMVTVGGCLIVRGRRVP